MEHLTLREVVHNHYVAVALGQQEHAHLVLSLQLINLGDRLSRRWESHFVSDLHLVGLDVVVARNVRLLVTDCVNRLHDGVRVDEQQST